MPRKPKREKQTIQVVIGGVPVAVILHPPSGSRRSWYAYWHGLVSSKSTGQANLADAIAAVENMIRTGRRGAVEDTILSDEEFEAIQRAHFGKKTDPRAKERAVKTLEGCLEAISAFREITGLRPITLATPDDCERFQQQALAKPANWRKQHPKSRKDGGHISPNTVLKWSRTLQAAFERANRNAGRKCVRGVVDEKKLLTANPWSQFTWIEGKDRPIRQLDNEELLSFLSFLETTWAGVPVGATVAKFFLWSSCRKLEVASLTWSSLRLVGNECHFELVGKWGVEKWFRIPEALYRELLTLRTDSPFVFAAYSDQIRRFHERHTGTLKKIRADFRPANLGSWFYQRVKEWSATSKKGRAFVHHFRKTTLQHARRGEDINRQIAADARVSEAVLMTHYVKETDEEMRQKSNRTFHRILASLSPEVAQRYGHADDGTMDLEGRLRAAVEAKDYALASELSARLAEAKQTRAG